MSTKTLKLGRNSPAIVFAVAKVKRYSAMHLNTDSYACLYRQHLKCPSILGFCRMGPLENP